MKNILFAGLFFTVFSARVIGQYNFPKFETLVNEFFDRYDLREEQTYSRVHFVKQKEGYFIEERDRKTNLFINKQLFWDARSGKYKKLDFPEGRDEENETRKNILNGWGMAHFDLYPYYGYINWEKDVIKLYESKTNLTDDELYALGRVYSSIASNLINNNSGLADSAAMFKFKEYGLNQLLPEQMTQYRFYRHKAIELFGQLYKRNPVYKTIVGSIENKYHNEFLTSFLDFRIYQNEAEAEKELNDSLFSDFYRDMAKNYLNSCDSNAILITNGDNDTYPLLYVQAQLGYRQDVQVVNINLLNNNNYINHLRYGKILKADSLAFILSPQSYAGDKLSIVAVKNNSAEESFIPLNEALQLIEDENPITDNAAITGYRYLVSDKLKIIVDSTTEIPFKLEDKFILKGMIIALDIIQSNIAKRPVYFLNNYPLKFDEIFELEGFAYKIADSVKPVDGFLLYGGINAEKTSDILLRNFCFTPDMEKDIKTASIVIQSYQRSFCHLAKYYSDNNMPDSCKKVIDFYCKVIPNSLYQMDYVLFSMIEAAYNSNLINEGDGIVSNIIDNMENKINKADFSDYDFRLCNYTIRELNKLTENADLENRLDNLQKVMDQKEIE